MTAQTQAENVSLMTPVAMLAVTQHVVDHRLPAPASISRPLVEERAIPVLVFSEDLGDWLPTLHVSYVVDEACGVEGKVRRTHHARLGNGIRVMVVSLVDDPGLARDDEDGEPVEPLGPRARALARAHVTGGVL